MPEVEFCWMSALKLVIEPVNKNKYNSTVNKWGIGSLIIVLVYGQ